MIVVFKGVREVRKSGCSVCGAKRRYSVPLQTAREYYLPSGITKTFRIGVEEEVSEIDGEFLLSLDGGVFSGR